MKLIKNIIILSILLILTSVIVIAESDSNCGKEFEFIYLENTPNCCDGLDMIKILDYNNPMGVCYDPDNSNLPECKYQGTSKEGWYYKKTISSSNNNVIPIISEWSKIEKGKEDLSNFVNQNSENIPNLELSNNVFKFNAGQPISGSNYREYYFKEVELKADFELMFKIKPYSQFTDSNKIYVSLSQNKEAMYKNQIGLLPLSDNTFCFSMSGGYSYFNDLYGTGQGGPGFEYFNGRFYNKDREDYLNVINKYIENNFYGYKYNVNEEYTVLMSRKDKKIEFKILDENNETVYYWLVEDPEKTEFNYLSVSISNFDDGDTQIFDDGTRGEISNMYLTGNALNIDDTDTEPNEFEFSFELIIYSDCDNSNSNVNINPTNTCKDSDNGIDIYTKGTIYTDEGSNIDICISKINNNEYNCMVDARACTFSNSRYNQLMYGNTYIDKVWDGEKFIQDYTCKVKEDEIISSSWRIGTEGCAITTKLTDESEYITEYYCSSDNTPTKKLIYCENGCKDGACLKNINNCANEKEDYSKYIIDETKLDDVCCDTLQPYSLGNFCYDRSKGVPECRGQGSRSEGWYYSQDESIITTNKATLKINEKKKIKINNKEYIVKLISTTHIKDKAIIVINNIVEDLEINELGKFQEDLGEDFNINLIDFNENEAIVEFDGNIDIAKNYDGELIKYADCDNSDSEDQYCKDSDNGLNDFVKGTVYTEAGSKTDICISNKNNNDYGCFVDARECNSGNFGYDKIMYGNIYLGKRWDGEKFIEDYMCKIIEGSNGAWSGWEFEEKGCAKTKRITEEKKYLKEYFCSTNNEYSRDIYCENDCENGACIEEIINPINHTNNYDCKKLLNLFDSLDKNPNDYFNIGDETIIGKLIYIQENGYDSSQNMYSFTLTFQGLNTKAKISVVSNSEKLHYELNKYYVIDLSDVRIHGMLSGSIIDHNSDMLKIVNCDISETLTEVEIPTTEKEQITEEINPNCNGCYYKDSCLSFGTRLIKDNVQSYCNIDKIFIEQKEKESSCQNNYECVTNQCNDGKCGSLEEEISGFRKFLSSLFSIFS